MSISPLIVKPNSLPFPPTLLSPHHEEQPTAKEPEVAPAPIIVEHVTLGKGIALARDGNALYVEYANGERWSRSLDPRFWVMPLPHNDIAALPTLQEYCAVKRKAEQDKGKVLKLRQEEELEHVASSRPTVHLNSVPCGVAIHFTDQELISARSWQYRHGDELPEDYDPALRRLRDALQKLKEQGKNFGPDEFDTRDDVPVQFDAQGDPKSDRTAEVQSGSTSSLRRFSDVEPALGLAEEEVACGEESLRAAPLLPGIVVSRSKSLTEALREHDAHSLLDQFFLNHSRAAALEAYIAVLDGMLPSEAASRFNIQNIGETLARVGTILLMGEKVLKRFDRTSFVADAKTYLLERNKNATLSFLHREQPKPNDESRSIPPDGPTLASIGPSHPPSMRRKRDPSGYGTLAELSKVPTGAASLHVESAPATGERSAFGSLPHVQAEAIETAHDRVGPPIIRTRHQEECRQLENGLLVFLNGQRQGEMGPKQQELVDVVNLYRRGLTLEEIAERIGRSKRTVINRLNYLRELALHASQNAVDQNSGAHVCS